MAQKKRKVSTNKKPMSKKNPKSKTSKNVVERTTSTVKKVAPQKENADAKMQVKIMKPNFKKFLVYLVMILVTLVAVDFIVQYINNGYSVAIINGHRIPRSEYEKRLEEAYGEVIATQLVNEQLILDEAQKEEIVVSEDDVQVLIDETIEEIGGEDAFESALVANGLTEEAYRRNLKIQLLAEKMVVTEPSEEDLLTFFEENKEIYFGEDAVYEDVMEDVKDLYRSQKFNENSSAWLSELRDGSNIQNNVTNEPTYGLLKITRELVTDLNNRLNED